MFDSELNIIKGERMSGRTSLLVTIAKTLRSSGLKVYFLGATHEMRDDRDLYEKFTFYDFFSSNQDNNSKIIEKAKEIIEKEKVDFLILDDLDYLSENLIASISKISAKKIASCLNNSTFSIRFFSKPGINAKDYYLQKYDSSNFVIIDNEKYQIDDILISAIRDQKLKFLTE